jgi:5'-phosphate synthase pdxT subunit
MSTLNIGVLCLQGAFIEHFEILKKLSNKINIVDVRETPDFTNLDALILPGGESTTIGILLEKY